MENYFNYFTEIEECYRKCRGTPSLLSPLDWALIESWKEAEYPLEAVLMGVERAFEKFHARPRKFRMVNGLAYCSQEVLKAVDEARTAQTEVGLPSEAGRAAEAPFTKDEVVRYLLRNAGSIEKAAQLTREKTPSVLSADLQAAAAALRSVASSQGIGPATSLEELENRMTVLEEKLTASLMRGCPDDLLAQFRREVQAGLVPFRRKMTGPQIESLERQFLKKRLFEYNSIPRLSFFYL